MTKKIIYSIVLSFFLFRLNATEDKLFPEIPGWKLDVNEQIYESGDLWELINGAADIFLSYYFEDLHIAEYTNKDEMIRVELYRHKTLEDTYGIYTAERMPDYPQVEVGSQGYKSQGVLNFMAGEFYVKIMSAGVDEVDEQTLALVAGKVDQTLAQPTGLPDVIKLFPSEGMSYLSDSYIAQNFLGYSFFHHAFTAKYEKPAEFQLFIIKLDSESLEKMLNEYIQLVKSENIQRKEELYIINDQFNGKIFLKQKNNYLVGVINTNDEEIANKYIGKVLASIN